jgi:hypothetical protein
MIIGFTGTRNGMTDEQKKNVGEALVSMEPTEVHHGDCIGADAEFHDICLTLKKIMNIRIVIHPPKDEKYRAFCEGADEIWAKREYLDRNHDIVDCSDILIGAPKGEETLRSGTWATIRYARKKNMTIIQV